MTPEMARCESWLPFPARAGTSMSSLSYFLGGGRRFIYLLVSLPPQLPCHPLVTFPMARYRKPTRRSSTSWKQRIQGLLDNTPSHETIRAEVQLLVDNSNINTIRGLAIGDQARFLEITDQVSTCHPCSSWKVLTSDGPDANSSNPENHEQAAPTVLERDTRFVATLGDIYSNILQLPNSIGSLQRLEKRGEIAVASGGTTDIWRGVWNNQHVAFKAFRISPPPRSPGSKEDPLETGAYLEETAPRERSPVSWC